MNANYHYYTIKTLAHYAGFDDEKAQLIACFSCQIDDYIMQSPFIVTEKPPEFFFTHKLALELSSNKWVFLPCPTGPNIIKSVSHNYQLHALLPFHFITPTPFNNIPANADRSLYRCVSANQGEELFINRLMEKAVESAAQNHKNDSSTLIALGMLLHTFADTYAHNGFSGFHGWENESIIAKMEHKLPYEDGGILTRILQFIREKFLGHTEGKSALSPAEIAFYSRLPSIGHANVSSAPDYCDCEVVLYGKKTKDDELSPMIERDNTEFFSDCSRRILDILSRVNGKPRYSDSEWRSLQRRLSDAQNLRNQNDKKARKRKWSSVFPGIRYDYIPNDRLKLYIKVMYKNDGLMNELGASSQDLTDMHSEEGEQARMASVMIANNITDMFYKYNELAYRHVYNVTGEYTSTGSFAHLENYRSLALNTL